MKHFGLFFLFLIALPSFAQAGLFDRTKHETIVHDGTERSYEIFVPKQVEMKSGRTPLVIMLHGGGGNGKGAVNMTGLSDKARQEGFIVVYPNGSGRMSNKLLTWNAGHCCGYAMKNKIDDVGFISSLIDKLVETRQVDPKRVYITGMSNGAMMSHRIGRELSHKVTAIAPVVGGLFGNEQLPPHPVSAIIINGALDKSVPMQGGQNGGHFADSWDGTPLKPSSYKGTFWATANGCDTTPSEHTSGTVQISRYTCPNGTDVVRYMITDNGHAWPGGAKGFRRGDDPSTAINATDVIWDFFKAHVK